MDKVPSFGAAKTARPSTSPLGVTKVMRHRSTLRCKSHGWCSMAIFARCAISLLCAQLGACDNASGSNPTIYAVMTPAQSGTFLEDLASLSKAHGLAPNAGSATSDRGITLRVLEARGNFLRLWAQNMPLSGTECPDSSGEATVDPGQFIITISPVMSLPVRERAQTLSLALASELRAKGYRVLTHPAKPCSAVYLSEGHAK